MRIAAAPIGGSGAAEPARNRLRTNGVRRNGYGKPASGKASNETNKMACKWASKTRNPKPSNQPSKHIKQATVRRNVVVQLIRMHRDAGHEDYQHLDMKQVEARAKMLTNTAAKFSDEFWKGC